MHPTWRLFIFCVITTCLARKLTISQTPAFIVMKTGQEVQMNCEQMTTNHDWMYWYHQEKGQGLKLIARKLKGQNPDYEGKYEDVYIMGSERDKHSSLRVNLTAQSQGVYFCASRDRNAGTKQEFGGGTILSVLGENEKQVQPKVKIYLPNKKEFQEHELISLVCVASGFFPEHVRITWYINDEKIESLYQNVPKKEKDGKFSTSSRLSVTKSQYFNPDNKFRCEAAFVGEKNAASDEIQGELGCGISKESYGRYMNQGKISYIMVLFKSGLYAVIVLAVIWRRKVLLGSC